MLLSGSFSLLVSDQVSFIQMRAHISLVPWKISGWWTVGHEWFGTSKSKAGSSRYNFGFRLTGNKIPPSIWSVNCFGGGDWEYGTPLTTKCMAWTSSKPKGIILGLLSAYLFSFPVGSWTRLASRSSPVRNWVFWIIFSNSLSTRSAGAD